MGEVGRNCVTVLRLRRQHFKLKLRVGSKQLTTGTPHVPENKKKMLRI